MQRYGMVTGVHPDKIEEYKTLHAAVWPDVLKKIAECNIRNYTIYLREIPGAGPLLFSHFEYIGDDFDADMAKMAADKTTQEWWEHCNPCQRPIAKGEVGNTWVSMEEVFHVD
jgi:L-rhamnose mutarotase